MSPLRQNLAATALLAASLLLAAFLAYTPTALHTPPGAGSSEAARLAAGDFATASTPRYLSAAALASMLEARPIRCVLDPAGGQGCAEVVHYDAANAVMTRTWRENGRIFETNAPYRLEDGAICVLNATATTTARDGRPIPTAAAPTRAKTCHRIRPAGGAKNGRARLAADPLGAAPKDPRPFTLRKAP